MVNSFLWPYLLISLHFVSGAIWIVVINRKSDHKSSKKQWIKYFTYVALFNVIWLSVIGTPSLFVLLGTLLLLVGAWEWWNAVSDSNGRIWFLAGYLAVAWGFWNFLHRAPSDILFVVFVVMLFDGSCQISGQVMGKTSLLPKISPNKTLEGLVGGTLITLASVLLVKNSFVMGWWEIIFKSLLIMSSAFLGDLAASFVKRKAKLATFGFCLPGHGGFLDRFDSLFMAAGVISMLSFLNLFWT